MSANVKLPPARVCATEQDYYDLWSSSNLQRLPPTTLAERGGRLADRAAWVFVGAYQGAMRQCFGSLREINGWASYLVSEARDESRQPTCTLRDDSNGVVLSGTKSWVAARPHLTSVVVSATQPGGATANVLVPVDHPGVGLLEKPSGRFLPELAVGSALFTSVTLPASAVLADDATHASLFGLIEARCLLVALAGHFCQWAPDAEAPQEALLLASGLTTAELGQPGSIAILLSAMTLLTDWFDTWVEGANSEDAPEDEIQAVRKRWHDDRRLLQMHRPMLERRSH